MPRKRIKLSEILPPTWVAVHTTASGRKGATRWMIYDGDDNYRGDLVRWMPEGTWSWQPYSEGTYVIEGTVNQCSAAIFKLAEE
jgi:hypothetical protein